MLVSEYTTVKHIGNQTSFVLILYFLYGFRKLFLLYLYWQKC